MDVGGAPNMVRYVSDKLDFDLGQFCKELTSDITKYYKVGNVIGTGGFAEVREVWNKESGTERAMKILNINNMTPKQREETYNEAQVLKKLDHPNILKIYECFRYNEFYFIIFEMCRGGELFDEIVAKDGLSEIEAAVIIKQILTCINCCHDNGIVHRDIKPENVLLEKNKSYDQLKLIDFGLSAKCKHGQMIKGMAGTVDYCAPEVL